ncbi:MAG: cobalt transporter CbiM [Thermodesulfobacteriota bacterium]
MHISEGVLSPQVLIAGAALAAAGTAIGLRKLDQEKLPLVGVLSATFFVASLVQVPAGGPISMHLVLNGVCGLLLGWAAFPAILVGLILQALLFQFGGLTTLGVTTFNIAAPAVLMGFVCRKGVESRHPAVRMVSEFLCGSCSVLLAALGVAAALMATGQSFWTYAATEVLVHIPVMIIEGIFTMFAVEFLLKVRPEMFHYSSASVHG